MGSFQNSGGASVWIYANLFNKDYILKYRKIDNFWFLAGKIIFGGSFEFWREFWILAGVFVFGGSFVFWRELWVISFLKCLEFFPVNCIFFSQKLSVFLYQYCLKLSVFIYQYYKLLVITKITTTAATPWIFIGFTSKFVNLVGNFKTFYLKYSKCE